MKFTKIQSCERNSNLLKNQNSTAFTDNSTEFTNNLAAFTDNLVMKNRFDLLRRFE
jgi:hypothetical protein